MLKVLIADDEQLICSMIRKMINWEEKGMEVAGTADNGLEVLRQIESLHPDIVITDIRMPGLDGLEMIEQAMKLGSQLDFVIISGYKSFEYAHQALSLGVRHYLLKPIDQRELSDTLDRIAAGRVKKDETKRTEEKLEEEREAYRKSARRHFLSSILQETSMEEVAGVPHTEETLEFRSDRYLAFFAKIDRAEDGDVPQGILEILQTMIEREEKEWNCDFVCSQVRSGVISVINYPPGAKEEHPADMEVLYTKCRKEIDKFSGYSVTIGVGSEQGDISGTRRTIDDAVYAVKCRIKKGLGQVLYADQLGYRRRDIGDTLTQEIRAGNRRAVEALDAEAVKGDFQMLSEKIRREHQYSPAELYDLIENFSELIRDTWEENSVDNEVLREFSLAVKVLLDRSTSEATLIQRFEDTVELYFRKVLAQRRQSGQAPIRAAKAYLAQHFMENPTLEEVADSVAMSPTYLSTLFKKEVGIGFSDYLIQLRCEEAKRLMRESQDPMAVIAEKVGYQDPKYFSRIFRKTVGIKPSEYRKLYQ